MGASQGIVRAVGLAVAAGLVASCGAVTARSSAGTAAPSPSPSASATGGSAPAGVASFYTYPSARALKAKAAGELFASEPLALGPGLADAAASARRIMYRSDGAEGPVAVTGFALTPTGTPPRGGWPVVAWAHGTAGVGPDCAPSRAANLSAGPGGHDERLITNLLRGGYAVVGTDYPGLGFPGRLQGYLQLGPESNAVVDSVRAARHLDAALGARWFSLGHEQGGAAALGAGEIAAKRARELTYLGTVSLAPVSDPGAAVDEAAKLKPPYAPDWGRTAALLTYTAVGARQATPPAAPSDLLPPRLVRQIPAAERLCLAPLGEHLEGLDPQPPALVAAGRGGSEALRAFFAQARPARAKSAGPVLLLQGGKDATIAPERTGKLRGRLCALKDTVQYKTYPDADHDGLLDASFQDVGAWLSARLNGKKAPGDCG
ncbi:lipase family protein [Streptomyces sp. SPB074]|uniref:lipase family protein n=1 Tax=Streptomyces sp. (strain SPB074) TaxID=465543 RepID=UPI0001D1E20D|nr:lipase family protein [Streptomyces sp. SPB074]EDY44377.2 secretory lipase [Streptomyces sp. SPB074]